MRSNYRDIDPPTRLILGLLLRGRSAINSIKFKEAEYLGDPINLIRIFSEKNCSEGAILSKSAGQVGIEYSVLESIARVARFPLSYGGGIRSLSDIDRVISIGYEKVILSGDLTKGLVAPAVTKYGSSAIVACLNVKSNWLGRLSLYENKLEHNINDLREAIKYCQELGVGEIIINSVEDDGCLSGLNEKIIKISDEFMNSMNLIYYGGVRDFDDVVSATSAGYSGVCASSFLTFLGDEKGILPTYPREKIG